MNLNALIDFTLVATNEGLGKASRASGISKATLSRRIADLEEQLGVRLIERSARGLKLTEAGELLLSRAEGPLAEVVEAMAAAKEGVSTPRGRLRVAAPVLFSQLAMGGIGAAFCAAYPDVTIEVISEDRVVDLVEEQFDVAIRINPSPDSDLVGRCFRQGPAGGGGRAWITSACTRRHPLSSRCCDVQFRAHPLDTRWRQPDSGADPQAALLFVPDDPRCGHRRWWGCPHSTVHRMEPVGQWRVGPVGHGIGEGSRTLGLAHVPASCCTEGACICRFHVRQVPGHVVGTEGVGTINLTSGCRQ